MGRNRTPKERQGNSAEQTEYRVRRHHGGHRAEGGVFTVVRREVILTKHGTRLTERVAASPVNWLTVTNVAQAPAQELKNLAPELLETRPGGPKAGGSALGEQQTTIRQTRSLVPEQHVAPIGTQINRGYATPRSPQVGLEEGESRSGSSGNAQSLGVLRVGARLFGEHKSLLRGLWITLSLQAESSNRDRGEPPDSDLESRPDTGFPSTIPEKEALIYSRESRFGHNGADATRLWDLWRLVCRSVATHPTPAKLRVSGEIQLPVCRLGR